MKFPSDQSQEELRNDGGVDMPPAAASDAGISAVTSNSGDKNAVNDFEAGAEVQRSARKALKKSCLTILADLPAAARTVVLREVTDELLTDQLDELLKQYAELEYAALYDPLTGALNREGFLRRGEQLLAQAEFCKRGTALVYLDADNLKRLNDQRGHEAGDQALKEAVALIHKRTRSSDVVARFGGDEFVILLTQCDEPTARAIVHRIISECRTRNESTPTPQLSFSAGLVWLPPGKITINLDSLIAMADERLYRAKHAGRGQMCAA